MLVGFGSFTQFVAFDKRGTGASDRRSQVAGIDERVADLEAVMDDAGFDSAHLFVQSDGGPMAILFAVTYPDRVKSLIFHGSGACLAPPWPEPDRIERRDRQVREWGTPDSRIVEVFAPTLHSDEAFRRWHRAYERQSASTDSLRELLDLAAEMDVREILHLVEVPTLVLHRTGDRVIDVEHGRELAREIPGARMVELPGDDHFAYAGDVQRWMTEVERFVTGEAGASPRAIRALEKARIYTLGGFRVEIAGEEVPVSSWGTRHARQICKRLVAARGWPITRDALIEMTWPDESDIRRLSARLSAQLSTIRRVLGGGVIADRETVRLDLDFVTTDLEDLLTADDDVAVSVYSGEFLPEDVYEDWTSPVRDEARAAFMAAAEREARRQITSGKYRKPIELARRMVEADRYAKAGHRILVEALAGEGRTSEARRANQVWQETMAEIDIDVRPFPVS